MPHHFDIQFWLYHGSPTFAEAFIFPFRIVQAILNKTYILPFALVSDRKNGFPLFDILRKNHLYELSVALLRQRSAHDYQSNIRKCHIFQHPFYLTCCFLLLNYQANLYLLRLLE